MADAAPFTRSGEHGGRCPETALRGLRGWVGLAALVISACAQLPFDTSPDKPRDPRIAPAAPARSPVDGFMASATAGKEGRVKDPRTGANVRITAGRSYHAASGRVCRRFTVLSPQGYDGMKEGLACRDERGHWSVSELLINRDDLRAPRRRYP